MLVPTMAFLGGVSNTMCEPCTEVRILSPLNYGRPEGTASVTIWNAVTRSEFRSRTRALARRIDLELGRSIGESIANSVARSENRSRTRSRDQRIDLQLGRSIRESISNSVARCKRNSTTRSTGLFLCGSTERRSSGWSIQQHEAVTRLSHGRTCTQTLPRPFVGNQVMSVCSPWTQRMWGRVLERLQLCKIKMYTKVPNHACLFIQPHLGIGIASYFRFQDFSLIAYEISAQYS